MSVDRWAAHIFVRRVASRGSIDGRSGIDARRPALRPRGTVSARRGGRRARSSCRMRSADVADQRAQHGHRPHRPIDDAQPRPPMQASIALDRFVPGKAGALAPALHAFDLGVVTWARDRRTRALRIGIMGARRDRRLLMSAAASRPEAPTSPCSSAASARQEEAPRLGSRALRSRRRLRPRRSGERIAFETDASRARRLRHRPGAA